ncbi:LexA/Signal peptidase [Phlegmacium glaucopus]|nr:LexA/Signal peptidase [Phlegmacium glaucopus]
MASWFTLKASLSPSRLKIFNVTLGAFKIANAAFAFHLFYEYVGQPAIMYGPSMLPTLAVSGEVVIEDCISVRLNPEKLHRGELIILKSPLDPQRTICKRIIGLPGDTVCVDPTGRLAPSTEHVLVPKGHIWISGDNAAESRDSRLYGPVPIALVHGRLYARVWPWKDFTVFRNATTFLE